MSRFPAAGHLLSWAGLCPRNDESAGKRRTSRIKKGAHWLKATLIQCAWAASRKKNSYLQAQCQRLRSRRGSKKATCAVAASMLAAACRMLKNAALHEDLGTGHFDRRAKRKTDAAARKPAAEPRIRHRDHTTLSVIETCSFLGGWRNSSDRCLVHCARVGNASGRVSDTSLTVDVLWFVPPQTGRSGRWRAVVHCGCDKSIACLFVGRFDCVGRVPLR